ncbi:MAG: hypothetical protein PVH17_04370, partial [Anaerolineae bacterium]
MLNDEGTGRVVRRLVTIGLLLILVLVVAWNVWASDLLSSTDGELVQYRIELTDLEATRLEVVLPAGSEYVGLAAGSQVSVEPHVSEDGRRLVWRGSFSGAEELRFWLAPPESATTPASLSVEGASVQAVRAEPLVGLLSGLGTVTSTSASAGVVDVAKTVDPEILPPGD